MARVRNFCFTSHIGKIEWSDDMSYLVMGDEVGEGGKDHVQGFVIFKNPRMLTGVIKKYKGIHWEICAGSPVQNMEYCKKDGKWQEWGTPPKPQGERTDKVKLGDLIKSGKSDREIIETEDEEGTDYGGMWVRNYRGIREARRVLKAGVVRQWEMDVRIYWGPTGCGKTRRVWDEFSDVYVKPTGKWWDGYQGQECVLIDDFDPTNCFDITYDFYLKLLDRYPMTVEVKGGFEPFVSKVVVFTSNYDPNTWFTYKENRAAFFRRVRTMVHMGGELLHNAHAQMLGGG